MGKDNIVELEMEDGSVRQFETELFSFENTGYCLLTSVEKGKYPEAFVMKQHLEDYSIRLTGIEDKEEYRRVIDYINLRSHLDNPSKLKVIELFILLKYKKLPRDKYETSELGEGMEVVSESIGEWWKQRFLINNNTSQAWEFMDKNQRLCTITQEDIDWESLNDLPSEVIERAKNLSAIFPTFIRRFEKGVAEVDWQINPDGRYYMDDDGYGMTDDEEITIYGFIDQQGKAVGKFKLIKDLNELKSMRKAVQQLVRSTSA